MGCMAVYAILYNRQVEVISRLLTRRRDANSNAAI